MSEELDEIQNQVGEHIDNLNDGLKLDSKDQVCSKLHGNITRAVIWLLRKMEVLFKRLEKNAIKSFMKNHQNGKILEGPFGIKIPLERGFAPRDAMILVGLFGIVYIIVQFHRSGIL